jgi:hypothetical protein
MTVLAAKLLLGLLFPIRYLVHHSGDPRRGSPK